jgi:hypothetical protein
MRRRIDVSHRVGYGLRVPRPWDITGDDLARWSQQYDAPGVLPDLVRRLLLATSPLSSISMNAHAGIRLRDWDGVVRSFAETPYCPDGTSIWELRSRT